MCTCGRGEEGRENETGEGKEEGKKEIVKLQQDVYSPIQNILLTYSHPAWL